MSGRLEEVYRSAERICIDKNSKIVCMSDCHRGVGNRGDNFLSNQNLFFAALKYYYEKGFSYIELGDGDELWENRRMDRIVDMYGDIFQILSKFYQSGRFMMLYGNHDCVKKERNFMEKACDLRHCSCPCCSCADCGQRLFEGMEARESVLLLDRSTGHELLLLHGHQGDLLNDTLWPLARFLVRYVWRPLELMGIYDPTSAARNYKKRNKTERYLDDFAKKKQILLMAGHTHRPVLPKPGESFYLNDGSCVHPRGITAMEIANGGLTLVKWSVMACHGRNLSVEKEILEGPVLWNDYWKEDEIKNLKMDVTKLL